MNEPTRFPGVVKGTQVSGAGDPPAAGGVAVHAAPRVLVGSSYQVRCWTEPPVYCHVPLPERETVLSGPTKLMPLTAATNLYVSVVLLLVTVDAPVNRMLFWGPIVDSENSETKLTSPVLPLGTEMLLVEESKVLL